MERFVSIGGRRVRYLEGGEGRAVLLVHAFPLVADMWRPQLEQVPAGWWFVAPDLRGFGGSARTGWGTEASDPRGAESVDDHASDLLGLVDTLGLDRPVVCGLSMGGYIAFALHRHAPSRLSGLVLCDTRPQADTPEGLDNRRRMLTELEAGGPAVVATAMLPRLLGPSTLAGQPDTADRVRALIERNTNAGIADAIRCLMTRPDVTADLGSIACPVLIVAGRDDALTPVGLHEDMHRAIAGSRLVVIERAGHLSNLEQPAAFNRALHGFLAGLDQAAQR